MRVCHFATRPCDAQKVNTQIRANSTVENKARQIEQSNPPRHAVICHSALGAGMTRRFQSTRSAKPWRGVEQHNPSLRQVSVTTAYRHTMRSIARDGSHELEIQRSRFLCSLARVETAEHAADAIAAIRKQHWDATHHCSAFRVGVNAEHQRSNDDGEPAGTAGIPMLEVLSRREITDTVAVVTRYYGGIKLGAGGLVRAYGQAVAEALDAVGTVRRIPHTTVEVTVDHPTAGKLDNELRNAGRRIAGVEYGTDVRLTVLVPTAQTASFGQWLADRTAGRAAVEVGPVVLIDVPDNDD